MTEDLETLKQQVEALKSELRAAVIDRTLRIAAEAAQAVNPDQAGVLFQREFKLDLDQERRVYLVGDDGQPARDHQGGPLALDRAMADWLKKNPHLVRPAGRFGAGSSTEPGREESGFTPEQLADPEFYRSNRERIHQFFNRR